MYNESNEHCRTIQILIQADRKLSEFVKDATTLEVYEATYGVIDESVSIFLQDMDGDLSGN